MSDLFEGFGIHMLHAKIHQTGEGCCCLKDLPCEHCPSHPDAYPTELASLRAEVERLTQERDALTRVKGEVTWRFVYPHHLAHDETDEQVYDAAWLANAMESLVAAERRASEVAENKLATIRKALESNDIDAVKQAAQPER